MTQALLAITSGSSDDRELARRICQACIEGLDVDGAAISLLTATASREALWASDATAERLEELQFSLNEGACMRAATTGLPVAVPDLYNSEETARWPIFAAAVAEQTTVRALFALPLQWGVANLGVLDMYRSVAGALSRSQWRDALSAADIAALMMIGRRTDSADPDSYPAAGRLLDHPMGSRAEVHQATGMVLAQLGVSGTEALARLRAHAFAEQRLLIEVARDVLARRLVFDDEMK